ncbi:hypothetical protein ACLBWT_09215 [Paenibacillus sp. D51F]
MNGKGAGPGSDRSRAEGRGRRRHPSRLYSDGPGLQSRRGSFPELCPQKAESGTVGLLGRLLVGYDGSRMVNGYCLPNDQGIATSSETGYRVMRRTGDNQILVLFR